METALARQAGEPVINFNPDMGYQSLHTVFRSSLADPALLNAILLTLTFAVHGDSNCAEFLAYKGEALRCINNQLQNPKQGVTGGLIGAILLLVGVEVRNWKLRVQVRMTGVLTNDKARLGAQQIVQAHINGIALLLQLSESLEIDLHDGIKRAIFWYEKHKPFCIPFPNG